MNISMNVLLVYIYNVKIFVLYMKLEIIYLLMFMFLQCYIEMYFFLIWDWLIDIMDFIEVQLRFGVVFCYIIDLVNLNYSFYFNYVRNFRERINREESRILQVFDRRRVRFGVIGE